MKHKGRVYLATALLAGLLCWVIWRGTSGRLSAPVASGFAAEAHLEPLDAVAVHMQGRLKSFESFAHSMVRQVSGPHNVNGQSPGFTYLDMMLRPERYHDADAVFVKSKVVRGLIADRMEQSLRASGVTDGGAYERVERFRMTGLTSARSLTGDSSVRELLSRMARDTVRSAKFVDQIEGALTVRTPAFLADRLRLIPPPKGDFSTPWLSVTALTADGSGGVAPDDAAHVGVEKAEPGVGALAGMDVEVSAGLIAAWGDLVSGWRAEDAAKVNAAATALGSLLPRVNPSLYPDRDRLAWEARYFEMGNLTWTWVFYMFSVALLLMGMVYGWRGARWAGLGLFLVGFALHTAALGLRWYVSGRWPNSNMFEAVTTAAWFGSLAAIALEVIARRSAMRSLILLTAAACSTAALMAANFLPLHLTPEIGNKMPVLYDVWLYIHTNVIIFSYCLIGMSAVTAGLYLLWRLGGGGEAYARAGGAGALILGGVRGMRGAAARVGEPALAGFFGAGAGGLESVVVQERGGAAAGAGRSSLGEVLDGVTMLLMELSFILLWAGIVMGAVWADHSWGRPWGWDPKEVFALNTFVIFAILVHIRLKVRDKGLWTAWLAVIGAGVMIFNWTVINFVITGLHSYA